MAKRGVFFEALQVFVKRGLLEFWLRALPDDQRLVTLLKEDILARQEATEIRSWKTDCDAIKKQRSNALNKTLFGQFIGRYELSISQLFYLALLGEVESSHVVNLVVAALQAPDRQPRPTVHLVQSLLEQLFDDEAGDGFAMTLPHSSLVRDGIVVVEGDGPLPLCQLRLAPMVWSIFAGSQAPWPECDFISPELAGFLSEQASFLAVHYAALFHRRQDSAHHFVEGFVVRGTPGSGRHAFTVALAKQLNLRAMTVPESVWQHHKALRTLCYFAQWLPVLQPRVGPGEAFAIPAGVSSVPLVVLLGTDGAVNGSGLMELTLQRPRVDERIKLWHGQLGSKALAKQLGPSVLLSGHAIESIAASANRFAEAENRKVTLADVTAARKTFIAEKLRLLAEPVFREVTEQAMVLPASVKDSLDHLLQRARRRELLGEHLGETIRVTPNPGVRGLFVGESGTGKTLAASYVATALGAPLYRVDLSSVMNKYIGESEKNLSQLLDYAAATDVVLLFDEADSLFGSRSEGKETGERFANMLTNFLLTRIENHPGVVILTTNSKERIDNAFNRRIDVVAEFPVPGFDERLALWRSHMGDAGPGESVYRVLAGYSDLAGGQVRNAVLAAATFADSGDISIEDLLRGIQLEYGKLGRSVPGKILRLVGG